MLRELIIALNMALTACLIGCAAVPSALAQNANGNDFALAWVEARSDQVRRAMLEEAGRRPHYFRYLQIVEMETIESGGRRAVKITALEPASALDVSFTINQRIGLGTLDEEPKSVPGRAVAVSGVIRGVDTETGTIILDPTVLRHKDRLTPKVGKELYYELDNRAGFYSFTGGREPVSVSFRDRDLLRHRDRILAEGGDQAWADFLQREIRRRTAERHAAGDHRP
jgi:hypothetical protein